VVLATGAASFATVAGIVGAAAGTVGATAGTTGVAVAAPTGLSLLPAARAKSADPR